MRFCREFESGSIFASDAMQPETAQSDAELLLKLLQKPEPTTLLKTLAKSL